jgi:hypothetical protein
MWRHREAGVILPFGQKMYRALASQKCVSILFSRNVPYL